MEVQRIEVGECGFGVSKGICMAFVRYLSSFRAMGFQRCGHGGDDHHHHYWSVHCAVSSMSSARHDCEFIPF
jgi:hypothetical protein